MSEKTKSDELRAIMRDMESAIGDAGEEPLDACGDDLIEWATNWRDRLSAIADALPRANGDAMGIADRMRARASGWKHYAGLDHELCQYADEVQSLAPQQAGEVWLVSGPKVRVKAFASEPTREQAPENLVSVQRVPVHGAPVQDGGAVAELSDILGQLKRQNSELRDEVSSLSRIASNQEDIIRDKRGACTDCTAPQQAGEGEGVRRISVERHRQVAAEGWTPEHDRDQHADRELVDAAICYSSAAARMTRVDYQSAYPWGVFEAKPNRLRNLEIAGALIAAEIDRVAPAHPGAPETTEGECEDCAAVVRRAEKVIDTLKREKTETGEFLGKKIAELERRWVSRTVEPTASRPDGPSEVYVGASTGVGAVYLELPPVGSWKLVPVIGTTPDAGDGQGDDLIGRALDMTTELLEQKQTALDAANAKIEAFERSASEGYTLAREIQAERDKANARVEELEDEVRRWERRDTSLCYHRMTNAEADNRRLRDGIRDTRSRMQRLKANPMWTETLSALLDTKEDGALRVGQYGEMVGSTTAKLDAAPSEALGMAKKSFLRWVESGDTKHLGHISQHLIDHLKAQRDGS